MTDDEFKLLLVDSFGLRLSADKAKEKTESIAKMINSTTEDEEQRKLIRYVYCRGWIDGAFVGVISGLENLVAKTKATKK